MRIAVFCGSRAGSDPAYGEAAGSLGRLLARQGIGVVYGGGRVGSMGLLADAALAAGGEVAGVIPRALVEREIAHQGLTELHVVGSMHQRKALMAELADGFIALPGGAGTLEELFEAWTWGQLGLHAKPCGLLNVRGYYDRLVALTDQMVREGFLRPQDRDMLLVERDAARLLQRLVAYTPPPPRWTRPDGQRLDLA
jgi:uncharacterized protein (TIGR00730 family)